MPTLIRKLCAIGISILFATAASAHDPFDGGTRMTVLDDRIEVVVTMGSDAARQFLSATGLPPREVATMTRAGTTDATLEVPVTIAPRLVALQLESKTLQAKRFLVAPNEGEIVFVITYPRPSAGTLIARATYFESTPDMRAGAFVAIDGIRRQLALTIVSATSPSVNVPLSLSAESGPLPPALAPAPARPSFTEFLKLGVEHILTGFDHLLFLCALLLGVKKIRPMLAIITAFTLAHSVTLAIAALNLVAISSRLIEPLIAVSIMVVGVENFLRRDVTADRYWIAGGFGLIHGFAFASALRETGLGQTGSSSIVLPLLSFNLGVEAGQLMVAAVIVPLLLLLRSKPFFARYSTPVVSALVILVSGYWLFHRISFR